MSVLRALAAVSLALVSCSRVAVDPPPPASRHDLVPAPPAALGAHAASTEDPRSGWLVAHPPLPSEPDGAAEDQDEEPDAGTPVAPAPEPDGVTL